MSVFTYPVKGLRRVLIPQKCGWTLAWDSLPRWNVKKAAELMKVKEITVWQWIKGARQVSPSMLLLMEFIASVYAPVKRPGISD